MYAYLEMWAHLYAQLWLQFSKVLLQSSSLFPAIGSEVSIKVHLPPNVVEALAMPDQVDGLQPTIATLSVMHWEPLGINASGR